MSSLVLKSAPIGSNSEDCDATRVTLAGKTVMPMVIDTHFHPSPTRELIMRDLQRRAIRRKRCAQPRNRQLRAARYAPGGHARRRALLERRARHHHARAGTAYDPALDHE
jgi:hypothetical protein